MRNIVYYLIVVFISSVYCNYNGKVVDIDDYFTHRALNVYLGIDTELVIYPGEGPGLSKHSHRMAKLKWDIEWFEKYLR